MKFKLDENLDVRLVSLVEQAGHEVDTVRDEGLSGESDDTIDTWCSKTDRILVTLDIGFLQPAPLPTGTHCWNSRDSTNSTHFDADQSDPCRRTPGDPTKVPEGAALDR